MELTADAIKRHVGNVYFQRGKVYYDNGRVLSCVLDANDSTHWIAKVRGRELYTVDIVQADHGTIQAICECPAFVDGTWCKHIVAVLLTLESGARSPLPHQDAQPLPPPIGRLAHMTQVLENPNRIMAKKLLSMFRRTSPQDLWTPGLATKRKVPLMVQFIVRGFNAYHSMPLLTVEMKIGVNRLYVVPNIREFLDSIAYRRSQYFTKRFTYDPAIHEFAPGDSSLIEILIDINRQQNFYSRSIAPPYSGYNASSASRGLSVPPFAWDRMWPLLPECDVQIAAERGYERPLVIAEGGLPVKSMITRSPAGDYLVKMAGLAELTVLAPYHCAIEEGGSLYALDGPALAQLDELKRMVGPKGELSVNLSSAELEEFMEYAAPQLESISAVQVDAQVAEHMVQTPLLSRIYLDRKDDSISAKVRFIYGEVVIDALAPATREGEMEGIVLRDVREENWVMGYCEQVGFRPEGGVLWMEGEDRLYQFLFHALPELEEHAEVYVTPAVHLMVSQQASSPRARLEIDETTGWLDISFDFGELNADDIRKIIASIVEKKAYHRLPSGAFMALDAPEFQQIGDLVNDLGITARDLAQGTVHLEGHRALPLIDHDDHQAAIRLGKSLRRWLDNLRNADQLDFPVPDDVQNVLRDYQRYGFQWMKTLSYYGFGGILADDMGLGKTLQSIAFILSERDQRDFEQPVLIISPASVVYNWEAEIQRFGPRLRTAVAVGTKAERLAILSDASAYDVIITSYPVIRRDAGEYGNRNFHAIILDEAQTIKNHTTQTAQAIFALQSARRFALTGTPVENSLDDLWSIYHSVFPALLGSRKSFNTLDAAAVARKVRPFLLRRLKTDVLKELPEKIETVNTSELATEQKALYLAYLAQLREETARDLAADKFQKSRIKILAGLTRLRQICCHPGLFVEDYQGESGKLEQLLEVIDESMGSGRHLLIFSQFTSMLEIIQNALQKRHLEYFYLDGGTPVRDRLDLCNRYNDGERPIFLISLKAGGTGLNLTGADTVILYDLWWNPAVEDQAADRAHRIGQKHVVQVIRMVTKGTIEEKIYALQEKKRDLVDQVVQANDEGLATLTEEDVRELLSL